MKFSPSAKLAGANCVCTDVRGRKAAARRRQMRQILTGWTLAAMLAVSGMAQTGPIAQRQRNQQKRIAQGVQSGELTPRETAKLEHAEAKINREVRAERKANGGNLTNRQKAQVTRQQNRVSQQIYQQKHDAQQRPH
jgi:hypothetical protein